MLKQSMAMLALACLSQSSLAADTVTPRPKYELDDPATSMTLEIKPVAGAKNKYEMDIYVGKRGCGGDFHGVGTLKGNTLVVREPKPGSSDRICSVEMTFSADGSKVSTRETDCGDHHGGACNFDAKMVAK